MKDKHPELSFGGPLADKPAQRSNLTSQTSLRNNKAITLFLLCESYTNRISIFLYFFKKWFFLSLCN